MNGKDALLPSTTDDEARGSLDVILSGGGVSLSSLLLMPASFDNNNDSAYQPLSLPPAAAFNNHKLLVGPELLEPSVDLPPPPYSLFLPVPPTTDAFNQLHSLETHSSAAASSSHKRPRQNLVFVPSSAIARQRRIRMSDKTRCLQKLIPLERQMDTATLYHETYKYIKFLEAQIKALQSMPVQAPPPSHLLSTTREQQQLDGDGLGRLNRQQLLQVMMHSQVAQTVMYTNGWCVFSAEQLASLQHHHDKLVEQRFL